MAESKEEYIATTSGAWARGDDEYDALTRLAEVWSGEVEDDVEVQINHVEGFEKIEIGFYQGQIYADEYISKEVWEFPADKWEEFLDHVGEIDLLVEGLFEAGEEVEE